MDNEMTTKNDVRAANKHMIKYKEKNYQST